MEKALKKKWVKALRGGRYKQARNVMRLGDSYCCLGVLCDIQGVDWSKVKNFDSEDLPRGFNAGLTKAQRNCLAAMNDGRAGKYNQNPHCRLHDFSEIADFIEAKY